MIYSKTKSAKLLEGYALRALFSGFNNKKIRYAVLRNYEKLPDRAGSRDIDLLVHPKDMVKAKSVICTLVRDMDLLISDVFEDDMFFSIWLFKRLDEWLPFTLSIDLFPGRRIYGQELYSVEEALGKTRIYNGIPVVQEHFVYLDKVLYNLAVGQPTHKKYDILFADIVKSNRKLIIDTLAPFIGRNHAQYRIDATATGIASSLPCMNRRKRIRMLLNGLVRRPISVLRGLTYFVTFRLRDQWKLRGLFLSISGPDGSGKTTLINLVISQLEDIYGKDNIHYSHFRPTLLPRIAKVAKKVRAVKTVDENYNRPHRAKPSGRLGSLMRLGYYCLDYIFGYMRHVRPVVMRREVMLFDRYYYDLIADSFRSRISLPLYILRFIRLILPMPQYAFFIDVDPEEIHNRKQELTMERIVFLNKRYGNLSDRGWLIRTDNNGEPKIAAAAIVDHIVADRDACGRKIIGL